MKKLITMTKEGLLDLHQDEQGAEAIEKLLIIAAIALPLLGVLLFFSSALKEWVVDHWDQVMGRGSPSENPGIDY